MHGEVHRNDEECVRDSVKMVLEYATKARAKGFSPTIYIDLDDNGMFKIGYAVPFIGKTEDNKHNLDWIRRKLVLDSLKNPDLDLTIWRCKIEGRIKQTDNVDKIRSMLKDRARYLRTDFNLGF